MPLELFRFSFRPQSGVEQMRVSFDGSTVEVSIESAVLASAGDANFSNPSFVGWQRSRDQRQSLHLRQVRQAGRFGEVNRRRDRHPGVPRLIIALPRCRHHTIWNVPRQEARTARTSSSFDGCPDSSVHSFFHNFLSQSATSTALTALTRPRDFTTSLTPYKPFASFRACKQEETGW